MSIKSMRAAVEAMADGPRFAVEAGETGRGPYAFERYGYEASRKGLTVSDTPKHQGWETDGGLNEYAIPRAEAEGLVALANARGPLLDLIAAAWGITCYAPDRCPGAGDEYACDGCRVEEALDALDAS